MAESKKITASNFTLESSWSCTYVFLYNSTGSFNSVSSVNQTTPNEATKTVTFSTGLPASAKILDAKVYATYSIEGWSDSVFKINGTQVSSGGSITLDASSITSGSVSVTFSLKANQDANRAHKDAYPTYNGSSSQSRTFYHTATGTISNIYLMVEYQTGSVIYHAENGKLVPYQLFKAENGVLVPYLIQLGEGGKLVTYG